LNFVPARQVPTSHNWQWGAQARIFGPWPPPYVASHLPSGLKAALAPPSTDKSTTCLAFRVSQSGSQMRTLLVRPSQNQLQVATHLPSQLTAQLRTSCKSPISMV